MFEHIDTSMFVVTFILWFLLIIPIGNKGKFRIILLTRSLFIFLLLIAFNYYEKNRVNNNIDIFKTNTTLICNANHAEYKVKKSSDWQIQNFYFTKDDLIVKIKNCKEL